MRVTVLAAGSRGDVQPYLALACGLKNSGHNVRFTANANFAPLAADYGLDFFPIKVDARAFTRQKETQNWLASDNILKLAITTNRVIRPTVGRILEDAWEACQGTEAIIYHGFSLPSALYIGEKLNVPTLPASIYPMPTREHQALSLNAPVRLPGIVNYLSHSIVDFFSWQIYRSSTKDLLGKGIKVPVSAPYKQLRKEQWPIVCGYSSAVLPKPADLPDHVHITGYWALDPAPGWQPDPKLIDFLDAGKPPIYVGFGSMGNPVKATETTELIMQALKETGERGVLAAGWSDLGLDIKLPDNIFVLESAPHNWLMPKMKTIIHHGGAGTTGAGLRAGVPNIVVPHFGDQLFWGKRVSALGAGPDPIPRKKLTTKRLTRAIEQTINENAMRQRAAAIGQQIQAEDGVSHAIGVFEKYAAS